ncbi:MAG: hypothetical protein ACP5I4_16255 [Oceanipulchritudo sp.]
MSATAEQVSELVDFPIPTRKKEGLVVRPSIQSVLRRVSRSEAPANREEKRVSEKELAAIRQEEGEIHEMKSELARLQAEAMESIRATRELELLLTTRERLLDDREAQLKIRLADSSAGPEVSALEKSLQDARQALNQASQELAKREEIIAGLRAEMEELKAVPQVPGQPSASAEPVKDFDGVTDPSLAEQVAFLKEREAFIEESENTLSDKAQRLQEWETRLQQQEHDQQNG